MLPQATPTADIATSRRTLGGASDQNRKRPTRRHSRAELLQLVASMARELEQRANASSSQRRQQATTGSQDPDALACLRAARHLRELLSIAEGRKSPAYWNRQRTPTVLQPQHRPSKSAV